MNALSGAIPVRGRARWRVVAAVLGAFVLSLAGMAGWPGRTDAAVMITEPRIIGCAQGVVLLESPTYKTTLRNQFEVVARRWEIRSYDSQGRYLRGWDQVTPWETFVIAPNGFGNPPDRILSGLRRGATFYAVFERYVSSDRGWAGRWAFNATTDTVYRTKIYFCRAD